LVPVLERAGRSVECHARHRRGFDVADARRLKAVRAVHRAIQLLRAVAVRVLRRRRKIGLLRRWLRARHAEVARQERLVAAVNARVRSGIGVARDGLTVPAAVPRVPALDQYTAVDVTRHTLRGQHGGLKPTLALSRLESSDVVERRGATAGDVSAQPNARSGHRQQHEQATHEQRTAADQRGGATACRHRADCEQCEVPGW